jgi:hypothetical protein
MTGEIGLSDQRPRHQNTLKAMRRGESCRYRDNHVAAKKCSNFWYPFVEEAFRIQQYALLRVKNTGKQVLGVEPKIPTLCNSKTFKDYKKARQVESSYLFLLVVFRI